MVKQISFPILLLLLAMVCSCNPELLSDEPATVLEVRTVGGARSRVIQDPGGSAAGGAALGYMIGGGVGAVLGAGMAAEDVRSSAQASARLDSCTVILELSGGEKRTIHSNSRFTRSADPRVTRCASLWPGDKVRLELWKEGDSNDRFWFIRMEGE